MITQYIQKSNCEVTQLDDNWLVLNTHNYTVTTLNEAGGYCWTLLDVIQSVDSIVHAIQMKFQLSVSNDTIKQDVECFLDHLLECGLIEYVDE